MTRVSRSIEHRVNFGDYEGITIRVSADRECDDGEERVTLEDLAEVLTDALADEIQEARRYAVPGSYIHDWRY